MSALPDALLLSATLLVGHFARAIVLIPHAIVLWLLGIGVGVAAAQRYFAECV